MQLPVASERREGAATIQSLEAAVAALRPLVDAHIATDRVRRYLAELCDTPAPSTAASAFRTPVLKALLAADGVLDEPCLHLRENFEKTGSTAILNGAPDLAKPLWYFAHLDTVSYLLQPKAGDRYPLVPFCYHLVGDGIRPARAYRYDLAGNRYELIAEGDLVSEQGNPSFRPNGANARLRPGDRVGVTAIDGTGLQLWILHENDTDKQQIPKLSSSSAADMDAGRGPLPASYRQSARGYHIAPQGSASTLANLRALTALPNRPVVTLDLLADAYVDPSGYKDLSFLHGVTAFLPSDVEIERLWAPTDLEGWVVEQARRATCHVAAKLGDGGSIVSEAGGSALHRVPIYAADVVDTNGAGDAYCGGFLAGLVAGRPVAECAAMGTVSASYVVEARGALTTRRPTASERDGRLKDVLARTRQENRA